MASTTTPDNPFQATGEASLSSVAATTNNAHASGIDTAETAAAAAALVVDSVVEGTVAAVIINNKLPLPTSLSAATTIPTAGVAAQPNIDSAVISAAMPVEAGPTTSAASEPLIINNYLPQQLPQQAQPRTPSGTTSQHQIPSNAAIPPSANANINATAPAMVQTYNIQQKSKRKERLEQNRISARESRKRKKSMIEELQRTVMTLTVENNDLNGRNKSLRSNLTGIGRKYPNSPSIQAILNGVPTPSPLQQQKQPTIPPVPGPSAMKMGGPAMATNFLQLSHQQLAAAAAVGATTAHAVQNMSVPVFPMVATAPHTVGVGGAPPAMVVPYMYIPQPAQHAHAQHHAHAPGGLVPIAAQAVPVVGAPHPVTVPAPPPQGAVPMSTSMGAPQHHQQQHQHQHHIVIAPQPAPLATSQQQQQQQPVPAPIPARSQAPIFPSQAAQPQAQHPAPVAAAPTLPTVTHSQVAPVPPPLATNTVTSTMAPVPNPIAEFVQGVKQESSTPV